VLHLPLVPLDEAELRSSAYWWFYDGSKAQAMGFQTRPLEDTIRDTVAWFRADGYRRH
jgi:hypothetical protein